MAEKERERMEERERELNGANRSWLVVGCLQPQQHAGVSHLVTVY